MHPAQIDDPFAVDVDKDIIVAGEGERLPRLISEGSVKFIRERVVVALTLIAAELVVNWKKELLEYE